jgi:hypothetical protein
VSTAVSDRGERDAQTTAEMAPWLQWVAETALKIRRGRCGAVPDAGASAGLSMSICCFQLWAAGDELWGWSAEGFWARDLHRGEHVSISVR